MSTFWFIILISSALTLSKPVKKSLDTSWLPFDNDVMSHDASERRLEKKTIFIAPKLECDEGYVEDSMGKCRKIVVFDERRHFEFILEKMVEDLVDYDVDVEEEGSKQIDPLQFNIPLFEETTKRINVITTTTKATTTTRKSEKGLSSYVNRAQQTMNSIFFLPPKYYRKQPFVEPYEKVQKNLMHLNNKVWDWFQFT